MNPIFSIPIFNRNRVSTYTIKNHRLDHSAGHSDAVVQKMFLFCVKCWFQTLSITRLGHPLYTTMAEAVWSPITLLKNNNVIEIARRRRFFLNFGDELYF